MINELFNIAIKDGNYITIDKFQAGDGRNCNCICPECGQPVQSNITSKTEEQLKKTYTNHFSHTNKNSICSGGYKETEIHLFAKSVIEKANSLSVPSEISNCLNNLEYINVRLEPAFPVQEYKQYRPDLILTTKEGENIAIEIYVTNDLSNEKIKLYQAHQFKCLKIDLTEYYKKDLKNIHLEL